MRRKLLNVVAHAVLPFALIYTGLFLWAYAASEVHGWAAMSLAAGMLVLYIGGGKIVEMDDNARRG